MKNIFIKNKKILFVLPLFFIVYLIYLAMFQLNTLVSLGIRAFTHGTMKMEKVIITEGSSIKEGRIEVLNSQLYDKKLLIADVPKLIIDYKNWKIDRINIYNPKAVFVRKDSDINFVTVFTGPSKKSDDKKEKKKKVNLSSPILKRINVYDADLKYVDNSYSREIVRDVDNVNGYVQFEKGYKVNLKFTGNKGDEKYLYTFDNQKMSYDMRIFLENINAEENLVQYGYDSEGQISDVSGIFNMDLRINEEGFFGYGKLEKGALRYADLNAPVTDASLNIDFSGKKIAIDGDYLVFGKKGKFLVEYNAGKGVDVDLKLKDVFFNELSAYSLLEKTNLQIDDFMFDSVDVNLSVKNHFKAQVDFKSSKGFKKEVVAFSNINGQLIYENGGIKVNNIHTDVKLDKEGRTVEREINGRLHYKNDIGKVVVNVRSPQDEFLSKIDLSFVFSVKKDILNFKLNSDIIDLTGKYDFNKKALSLNQKKNFNMVYNLKNNHIDLMDGYIDFKLDKYTVKNNFNTKDGYKIDIESKIFNKEDEIKGSLEGYADIKSAAYDFKIKAHDFNLKDYSGSISGGAEGYIKRENGILDGEFFLDNLSVEVTEQKLKVSNILGTVNIKKEKDFSAIFQGEIGKIKYAENEINGFKISTKYSDGTLEVMNAANKFLTLSGKYSIINSRLDLFIKGTEINKDVVNISDINYNIQEINGNISGSLDDLNGKFTVNNGVIDFGENKTVHFGGDIDYSKNKVFARNFKINENTLSFDYYLDKKIGNYHIDIFETMLSEFILGVKFRIIGISNGTIKNDKISGNFKGSVNEFYYKGTKIPNVLFEGEYNNDNILFKNIDILSPNDEKLVSTEGIIDLKEKSFDFAILKQTVPVNEIFNKENLAGTINVQGKAKGTFDNYNFELKASEGNISYKGSEIKNIGIDVSGDKEKIVLNNFTAGYLNNSLKSDGIYNMADGKYKFNVNSSDIDLSFLSVLLEEYGIDDISGKGKLNLVFSDIVPNGQIAVNNFNLSAKKYGISLKNLNGDIALDKGYLRINKFKGNMNDGTINLKGYVELSKLINQLLDENFGKIDYNLSLEGKNINYSYEDYFNVNFNTNLSFRRNAVFGSLVINEGKIEKILKEDFGIVSIVKNFLRNFFRRNKTDAIALRNARGIAADNDAVSGVRINVNFNIDKGIDVKVNKATNFFTNINGKIMGQGRLSGKLGRLNFLGETSIKDGEFVLNGNRFTIDRALVLFNNRNEYIPDLNPEIVFSTSSIIDNKSLEIALNGPVRNLTFMVRSGNEVSVNSLDSVLEGNGTGTDGNNNVSILLTNLIGGQISDIVINPIVNILRGIGFSNLNVRSSILAEEKRKDVEQESSMVLGAYVEAESPIYKDKLFWKVKVNFVNEGDNNDSSNNSYNYGVADYDINVYNRINKNLSWGVGAQKLRENMDFKNRDMNYYIELKFEKKFDF